MLEEALVLDARGNPIRRDQPIHSDDWDEVQEFCRQVYMPYRVRPLERLSKPNATMISADAGQVTMTRFSYGTGIHLDQFDEDAGKILVLNTLRGALNHQCDKQPATTGAGESFVVDCSRTDYWLEGDADHMQLNLTIPHDVVAETARKWFGFVPDDTLWTRRAKFGGPGSRWLSLLDYAARTLGSDAPMSTDGPLGRHLEEMLCLELLVHWAKCAGISLQDGARSAAPRYVRQAEEILSAEAREAPRIGDVAMRVGVSARTLSEGFRRFRGLTPREFLAARRLEGLRTELREAPPHRTVSQIANDWGYVNLGALAAVYRNRFGELPSHTRERARHLHA
ncbi:AraC family transcriptional regulator [Amaricoccus tamworthensis]|uniref:AraC family transcriptional regulator n=1 Tax=Amaricoccus tamworthensis TaxID=57002 RepID=UPI003C7E3601